MIQDTYVSHPKNEGLVVFWEWQVKACDGDCVGAALLSFFEHWHNTNIDRLSCGQAETLYQSHSEIEIVNSLLGMPAQQKIRSSLKKLVDLGFVSVHKPPNPSPFDKTKYFLFHPEVINQYLETLKGEHERNPQESFQHDTNFIGWNKYKVPIKLPRSSEYRRHKRFVFKRDGFKCVYCGSAEKLTLDHQIPQSRGGSHEPDNLVTCCATCNSKKHARTPEEWRAVLTDSL